MTNLEKKKYIMGLLIFFFNFSNIYSFNVLHKLVSLIQAPFLTLFNVHKKGITLPIFDTAGLEVNQYNTYCLSTVYQLLKSNGS